jgi:hypothetical protein
MQAALRREKRDLDQAVKEFETRGNAVMDQKERELNATPEEKLASERKRAVEIDDEIDAIRKRIHGG